MEAGADFQEAADAALDLDLATGGGGDAGEDFEQFVRFLIRHGVSHGGVGWMTQGQEIAPSGLHRADRH